jgi:radical SAM superfamily enzyme YgiQ (UPF0313 family)
VSFAFGNVMSTLSLSGRFDRLAASVAAELRFPSALRTAPPLPPPVRAPVARGRILLLCPFYPKSRTGSFGKHVLTPSLALSSLAAVTPASWTVDFWDENLLQGPPPFRPVPEIVGITVHLTFARRACELARAYRALGSVVVMGGPHLLACSQEVAAHADAVVVGEGLEAWPRILEDHRRGRLQSRYRSAPSEIRDEPPPDRRVLPPWAFLTPQSLVATRGCSNQCDFCWLATRVPDDDGAAGSGGGGGRVRFQVRPPKHVAAEILASKAPYAVFLDNNLGADRRYLAALCREIAPLNRIWSAAVSLDVTDDPTLVATMARSGCTGVFIGFESLDDANLAASGKRSPQSEDWARRVSLLHDSGIQVDGSFVVGFDHDGPEVFDRLFDWVEAVRLECATYHILTPYPGTPLFRRFEAEGRLLHRDWSLYDTAHCVFRPARMSPDALESGYAALYERTFAWSSIWRRRPADPAAVAPYLAMSTLYKKMNLLWPTLIRRRLVHAVWTPLVEASRLRHLAFRRRLSGTLASGLEEGDRLGRVVRASRTGAPGWLRSGKRASTASATSPPRSRRSSIG